MQFDTKRLQELSQRAKSGQMTSEDRRLWVALLRSYTELLTLLKDPDTTFDDLAPYLPSDECNRATDGTASDRGDSLPEGGAE